MNQNSGESEGVGGSGDDGLIGVSDGCDSVTNLNCSGVILGSFF